LSQSIRLALRDPLQVPVAGPFTWQTRAEGFQTGELPIFASGGEVERILLARVDPRRYRIQIQNRPAGDWDVSDWRKALGASLVVKVVFFGLPGNPATPMVSAGVALGPSEYDARQGAFVVSSTFVGIRDLAKEDWQALLRTADYGLVSHPLLIAPGRPEIK